MFNAHFQVQLTMDLKHRSDLAAGLRRELSPDQDVSQVLGAGEGCHGGQWHILSSTSITVKQALVAMADKASYIRQPLVKG